MLGQGTWPELQRLFPPPLRTRLCSKYDGCETGLRWQLRTCDTRVSLAASSPSESYVCSRPQRDSAGGVLYVRTSLVN